MTTSEAIEGRPNAALTMTTRQRLILILLLVVNFMLSADFSILNVALPMVGKAVGLEIRRPSLGDHDLRASLGRAFAPIRAAWRSLRAATHPLAGLSLLAVASLLGGLSTGSPIF